MKLSILSAALLLVPAGLGCGDDDGTGGLGGGGGTGGGGPSCADEIAVASPDLSADCAGCICTDCATEFNLCQATEGCQGHVECAQAAIADGICDPDAPTAELLECIPAACDGIGVQAFSFLACIADRCASACISIPDAGMPDAGMDDAGMSDAGMSDAGPIDGGL